MDSLVSLHLSLIVALYESAITLGAFVLLWSVLQGCKAIQRDRIRRKRESWRVLPKKYGTILVVMLALHVTVQAQTIPSVAAPAETPVPVPTNYYDPGQTTDQIVTEMSSDAQSVCQTLQGITADNYNKELAFQVQLSQRFQIATYEQTAYIHQRLLELLYVGLFIVGLLINQLVVHMFKNYLY